MMRKNNSPQNLCGLRKFTEKEKHQLHRATQGQNGIMKQDDKEEW